MPERGIKKYFRFSFLFPLPGYTNDFFQFYDDLDPV